MRKFIILTLCCLFPASAFAINPLKGLRALNKAAFTTPLDAALTRQTFSQLQAARQLAAYSQAERTLLLTHKFIEETNRWPRTVIFRNGQLLPPAQYTPAEQQETNLGNQLRYTLEESPHTSPAILAELELLKTAYAPKRKHVFILEQLNAWLSAHPWPRETIPHDGRTLTAQEKYEITLATGANKILESPLNAIPQELVEQLRSIRQLTDLEYYPTPHDKQQAAYEQLLNQVYAWLNAHHTWPQATRNASKEERALSANIGNVLHAADLTQYPMLMELSTLKSIYQPLTEITANVHTPVPTRPEYDFYTPESELGRTRPIETTDGFAKPSTALPPFLLEEENQAVLLKLLDWLKEYHTWPHIYSTTGNPQEIQLAKNLHQFTGPLSSDLRNLRKQWQNRPFSLQLAKATAPQTLINELVHWIIKHNRWPADYKVQFHGNNPIRVPEEEYTLEDIEETDLANRVAAFVTYANEFEPGKWKKEPHGKWWILLQFSTPFKNPDLEQLRQLYRQYNND